MAFRALLNTTQDKKTPSDDINHEYTRDVSVGVFRLGLLVVVTFPPHTNSNGRRTSPDYNHHRMFSVPRRRPQLQKLSPIDDISVHVYKASNSPSRNPD